MTTADTGELQQEVAGGDTTVADLTGRTLLGVGPPMAGKDRFAAQVLRRATATNRDTLHIAATRGYDRLAQSFPERTRVVDCSPAPSSRDQRVVDVATPGDLTGIGMPVSRFVEHADPRPVVTLDSVSTLLVYAEESAVFRFLAVLAAQLREVDGVGVFLMEDGCHDQQTVSTFQQLFDGRVDIDAERVRVRGIDAVPPRWVPR